MNSLLVAALAFFGFILAYRFYSRFLSDKIFGLRADAVMPAHKYEDGVDFVPTNTHILLGHHYTSIAGAAPIVGPAIAIFWGWLPAVLWVVFGSIFIGAEDDP
ncbi:MAG TPA: carbon starvation CstA family protein, partial [bacterium]|nr:carbon starvation CstA family protein [bacterium]